MSATTASVTELVSFSSCTTGTLCHCCMHILPVAPQPKSAFLILKHASDATRLLHFVSSHTGTVILVLVQNASLHSHIIVLLTQSHHYNCFYPVKRLLLLYVSAYLIFHHAALRRGSPSSRASANASSVNKGASVAYSLRLRSCVARGASSALEYCPFAGSPSAPFLAGWTWSFFFLSFFGDLPKAGRFYITSAPVCSSSTSSLGDKGTCAKLGPGA